MTYSIYLQFNNSKQYWTGTSKTAYDRQDGARKYLYKYLNHFRPLFIKKKKKTRQKLTDQNVCVSS